MEAQKSNIFKKVREIAQKAPFVIYGILIFLGVVVIIISSWFMDYKDSSVLYTYNVVTSEADSHTLIYQKNDIDCQNINSNNLKTIEIYQLPDNESSFVVYSTNADYGKKMALLLVFFGYSVIVMTIICVIDGSKKIAFKKISMQSFFVYVLFAPLVVLCIFAIVNYFIKISPLIGLHIYGIAQCFFLALWFGLKLRKNNTTLSAKECNTLDEYSTKAILVLTIVWVVYDISYIKIYFAIIMAEFMFVQLRVKMIQNNDSSNNESDG